MLSCKNFGLSGNVLKIIACISMFIDHAGVILFPNILELRIIGRIAFPIFAFMIAEGCKYTKNKLRYFLFVFGLGVMCQTVFYIVERSFMLNILFTFSLSILIIYALQCLKKALFCEKANIFKLLRFLVVFICLIVGTYYLCEYVYIDYGFYGCLAPVFLSLLKKPKGVTNRFWDIIDKSIVHLVLFSIGLILLYFQYGGIMIYAFLSLPFLLLYSGKRGKYNLKYLFYIFYPFHFVVLYGIWYLI